MLGGATYVGAIGARPVSNGSQPDESAQTEQPVDLGSLQRALGLVGGSDQRGGEVDLGEELGVLELDVQRVTGHFASRSLAQRGRDDVPLSFFLHPNARGLRPNGRSPLD